MTHGLFKRGKVWSTVLAAALLTGACAKPLPYVAAPLPQEDTAVDYAQRDHHDLGLTEFVRTSGYDEQWPPEQWRLSTLSLLALYFNPAMDVARAEAIAADAALTSAARRSPLSIELAAEHHSREVDGPWSLGIAIGLPIGTQGRRQARVDKASLLADAAEIEIAATAWRIRSAVRDALVELLASEQRARLLEQRLDLQQQRMLLVERRVAAGMYSARDLDGPRMALATARADLALERTRHADAVGALATALGLPLETVDSLRIADDALDYAANVPDTTTARSDALRNRLDVHVRLLEYGAADAEVRLAVAQQYPGVTLSPGFFWDQGDQVWTLLSALVVPREAQAAVRQAEARRDVAASRFAAQQIRTIGEVEQAREFLQRTRESVETGAAIAAQAQAQLDRARSVFEAGGGDRLELLRVQLGNVQAREHALAAETAWRHSVARFEDAVQRPLVSDFPGYPGRADEVGATQ